MIEEKYESIATKISAEQKKKLDSVLGKLGMNYYQWFQWMAEITIRIFDDRHQLTPEMSKMIQLYQMIPGWKDPTTFLDPNCEPQVEQAVYLMNTKGKQGLKAVLVKRGWIDGEWSMTENVIEIVEHIIEVCLPQSYKMLRRRMTELGCNRVFECLLKLADEATDSNFDNEIQELFSDNDRGDFGQKPQSVRTKQRKRVGVEDMQGLFALDEHDARMAIHTQEELEQQEQSAREASQWLRDHNDFLPHGGEW
jgi:hypothetical protein